MGEGELLDLIEKKASETRDQLIALNQKGDLDILTLLEIAEAREPADSLKAAIEENYLPTAAMNSIKEILNAVEQFYRSLEDYTTNLEFLGCFELCLEGASDIDKFRGVKNDWMGFRKYFMFNLKVSDQILTLNFIFLECLFRMLLIWHERIDVMNAKKNLRMINHLIIKYDLNSMFKRNKKFIIVMNLLGEKFEDIKLRKRLKEESFQDEPQVDKQIKSGEESPKFDSTPNDCIDGLDNASFLSNKTGESSFSFDDENIAGTLRTTANEFKEPSQINSNNPSKSGIEIDPDVREVTQTKLFKLLENLGVGKNAKTLSESIEAQFFSKSFDSEQSYDKLYSAASYVLESIQNFPQKISELEGEFFSLDSILKMKDTLISQDSNKRKIIPRQIKSLPVTGNVLAELTPSLQEEELKYLHSEISNLREENSYLKRLVFELRLQLNTKNIISN